MASRHVAVAVLVLTAGCSGDLIVREHDFNLTASTEHSYNSKLGARCLVTVKVVEMFGSNIEFKVLHDGKPVLTSGICRGVAKGKVMVEPGVVSVVLMNHNVLESKSGSLTVHYEKAE